MLKVKKEESLCADDTNTSVIMRKIFTFLSIVLSQFLPHDRGKDVCQQCHIYRERFIQTMCRNVGTVKLRLIRLLF